MKRLLVALLFPITTYAQSTQNMPCAMSAADIRMFADDYQTGVPLSTELKRYGNHDFRRSMIQQTYQISAKSGGSPADIQQAAYEQCSASSQSN
jgi:hypothetical protein